MRIKKKKGQKRPLFLLYNRKKLIIIWFISASVLVNILIMGMGLLKLRKAKKTGQHWLKQKSKAAMITLSPSLFSIISHPRSENAAPICPKQGCLLSSQYQQIHRAITAKRLYPLLIPLWLKEKWYSPARESACCYGNTSHLGCSHPTLHHVNWQWRYKKKGATKTTGRVDEKTEDRKRNDAQTDIHSHTDDMLITRSTCSRTSGWYRISWWMAENNTWEIFLLVMTYTGIKWHSMAHGVFL